MWHRHNDPLPKKAYSTLIPSVNETTSVLTIPNVTSEDVGMYYCVVLSNTRIVESRVAKLFLAGIFTHAAVVVLLYIDMYFSDPPAPPKIITTSMINLSVNFSLETKCLPEKNYLNYRWIKKMFFHQELRELAHHV